MFHRASLQFTSSLTMRWTLVCLTVIATLQWVNSAPVDPEEEFELVPAVTTNSEVEPERRRIPVILIQGGTSPFFGSGGFGGHNFPGFRFPFDFDVSESEQDDDEEEEEEETDIFNDDEEEDIDEFPLFHNIGSFFGGHDDNTDSSVDERDSEPPCGFLCQILKSLDENIKRIDEEIKNIRKVQEDKKNEVEGESSNDDNGFDVHNTTYTEKVLPDGTVLKVNRTVVSDSDDDGSTFFYHSTSFHNVYQPEDEEDKPIIDEDIDEVVQTKEYDEEVPAVIYPDDTVNEVDEGENILILDRRRRMANDNAFMQQTIVVGAPAENEILGAPANWKPLHDDTRVNDMLLDNGRRGGLIRIEPESELITRDRNTGHVVPIEQPNLNSAWAQQEVH